jgi:hypothetical protein
MSTEIREWVLFGFRVFLLFVRVLLLIAVIRYTYETLRLRITNEVFHYKGECLILP